MTMKPMLLALKNWVWGLFSVGDLCQRCMRRLHGPENKVNGMRVCFGCAQEIAYENSRASRGR